MKRSYWSYLVAVRFVLGFAAATFATAVLVTSCDIGGLFGEEESNEDNLPPESSLPALEALVSVVNLVTESDVEDPLDAAYPTGMTLQAGSSAEEISITLAQCHLQTTSDACLSGDFDLSRTTTASTATIAYSGTATMTGCNHTSAAVDVAATFSYDPNSDTQADEPEEITGSISLDGTAWEFSAVLDALEAYQDERTIDPLNIPARGRFFAVGLASDRWTGGRGGTVVYSPDGEEWALLWVEDDVTLTSIAAADDGSMVAVSAESLDWMPQGVGTIWHSTNGDDWTKVHTTSAGYAFSHVAWSDGLWVAVGSGGMLAISTDGTTWTNHVIPTDDPDSSTLWEIGPGEDAAGNTIWVLGGGRRMDDGQGGLEYEPIWWYITHVDLAAGPQTADWTAVGMDNFQDQSGMDAPPQTFRAITWDPGTGDWFGAPMGGAEIHVAYWDGDTATETPQLVLDPTDGTEKITPQGDLGFEGFSVVADPDGDRFYRFALEQYFGNGFIHRSLVDSGGTGSWMSRQMATSHDTPLFEVAGGPISGSETAQSVLISGGGDIWVSSDYGAQWSEVKRDWYGVRGLVYRP